MTLQAIPFDDATSMFWDNQRQARTRRRGSGHEHVELTRPLPLPPAKQCPDLRAPAYACAAREPKASRRPGRYFCGIVAASRLRPLRRRRAISFRPAFVFIRPRKPCLRSRFRFRGWYVGFTGSPPRSRCQPKTSHLREPRIYAGSPVASSSIITRQAPSAPTSAPTPSRPERRPRQPGYSPSRSPGPRAACGRWPGTTRRPRRRGARGRWPLERR